MIECCFQIRELVKKFKGPTITLPQFQEVASLCARQNKSPKDEVAPPNCSFIILSQAFHPPPLYCLTNLLYPQLSESLSVFDVDGEGFLPLSHFK